MCSDFQGKDSSVAQLSSSNKDLDLEAGQIDPSCLTSAGALQEIAFKSGTKVKYFLVLCSVFVVWPLIWKDGCLNYL